MNRKEIAKEILDANLNMNEVFVCSDGQGFSTEGSGINHEMEVLEKRSLNDDELPEKFTREDLASDKPAKVKLTAEKLVVKIGEATTPEEVDAIVGSDNRATVTKAAEAKLAELKAAAEIPAE